MTTKLMNGDEIADHKNAFWRSCKNNEMIAIQTTENYERDVGEIVLYIFLKMLFLQIKPLFLYFFDPTFQHFYSPVLIKISEMVLQPSRI